MNLSLEGSTTYETHFYTHKLISIDENLKIKTKHWVYNGKIMVFFSYKYLRDIVRVNKIGE